MKMSFFLCVVERNKSSGLKQLLQTSDAFLCLAHMRWCCMHHAGICNNKIRCPASFPFVYTSNDENGQIKRYLVFFCYCVPCMCHPICWKHASRHQHHTRHVPVQWYGLYRKKKHFCTCYSLHPCPFHAKQG